MFTSFTSRGRGSLLLVSLLAAACGSARGAEPDREPKHAAERGIPAGVEYDRIEGRFLATMATWSLCQLVRHPMFEAAGLYRVDRLTGVTEEDLWSPGTMSGFTYVELSLVKGWHRAEKKTVARILGGPYPPGPYFGRTGGWRISLAVGEVIGLLLADAAPENRGYPGIHVLGLFQTQGGRGFSNGQLFTKAGAGEQQLGDLVQEFAGVPMEAPCSSSNVYPDDEPVGPLVDPEVDVISNEVIVGTPGGDDPGER